VLRSQLLRAGGRAVWFVWRAVWLLPAGLLCTIGLLALGAGFFFAVVGYLPTHAYIFGKAFREGFAGQPAEPPVVPISELRKPYQRTFPWGAARG